MEIKLSAKGGSYDILIERGCLQKIGKTAVSLCDGSRAFIITDSNVAPFYLERTASSLVQAGFQIDAEIVDAGEHNKSLSVLEQVYSLLARAKITRGDILIALGGGVIGDLCGFAAASYLRGVPFVQIPTTLLAQTDSSVGGKCGINMPFGKNTVGAFYQPKAVLIDPNVLDTLPKKEFSCGMAEVIKYGCIKEEALFCSLENGISDIEEIIRTCIEIKKNVVQKDEFDTGERMLLNFGHTFGHAIEKLGSYETHTHGQAVAIGMVMAAKLGQYLGITPLKTDERISSLCKKYGLDFVCPYEIGQFSDMIAGDKKNIGKNLNFILLNKIGDAIIYSVPGNEVLPLLNAAF